MASKRTAQLTTDDLAQIELMALDGEIVVMHGGCGPIDSINGSVTLGSLIVACAGHIAACPERAGRPS